MNAIYMECGISRQAHDQMVKRSEEQAMLIPFIIGLIYEVRTMHPGMGLRTIYEKIQPQGIGRDNFIALGVQYGLEGDYRGPKTTISNVHGASRYTNLLVDREFNDVNQVWSSDITYFKLGNMFYYISLIMDIYSRRIIGYELSDNLRAENNIRALKMALETRGVDHYSNELIHHSDRGSQYVSKDYVQVLQQHGIRVSMCRNVYENTHLERVNRTIKRQYLKKWSINNSYELNRKLKDAIDAYNYDRPHHALSKATPVSYELRLEETPKNQHKMLKIFTIDQQADFTDPAQIRLFND